MELGDWLICTRMDCTLLSSFFWCPAKVTPTRRRSLKEREDTQGVATCVSETPSQNYARIIPSNLSPNPPN